MNTANLEQYKRAFIETFGVEEASLEDLEYQGVKTWDSVGHMSLIAALEDTFDLMLDTDDIIDFNSYQAGKEILNKYDVEL